MSTVARRTFPLVPRRRSTGLPFGDLPSRRRGYGSDIIGARPYRPGDPVTSIDWLASARLSSATGADEFVVREHAADEAARVVVVVDRRPAMRLYPEPLPWLSKHDALREAVAAISASATAARADIGSLDFAGGEPSWTAPARRPVEWRDEADDAPDDTLTRSFRFLLDHRSALPASTFVFVLSDFLAPPPADAWQDAARCGWDVVPVVIQDPLWEASFPDVGGVGVTVADPRGGGVGTIRLTGRQVRRRRAEHELRWRALHDELASFGLDVVDVADSDPAAVDGAFIAWAESRRRRRWTR